MTNRTTRGRTVLLLVLALVALGCNNSGGVTAPGPEALDPAEVSGANRSAGESGAVAVVPASSTFGEGEDIELTVRNDSSQTVFVEDMKTDCSIVTLEKSVEGEWATVWGCGMERLPQVVAIEPGGREAVVIRPSSNFIVGEPGLRAGSYRARFSYRLARGPEGEEPEVAYSPEFSIGS